MSGRLIRGRVFGFLRRPQSAGDKDCYHYWENGVVVVTAGRILWRGDFSDLPHEYSDWIECDHRPHLIMPGLVDAHTHFVQMRVVASYGAQLLDWLSNFTFPEEARFSAADHAERIAEAFLDELCNHGVTTAAVFGSVHKVATEALFSAAFERDMCLIAGKCLMDRGAPENVTDTVESGRTESQCLIDNWHGKGRLHYAVTPRFAITSTHAQLESAGDLLKSNPGVYLQSHLSENWDEIAEAVSLFPECTDYLSIYEAHGLIGPRTLLGHCIHLTQRESEAMRDSGAVAVFCPSSNLFLGSGLFKYDELDKAGVRIALASDIGGGTSYSMLATAAEAYKVCQMTGFNLTTLESFYRMTLGGAEALSLNSRIGNLDVGSDADLVIFDSGATPAMALRKELVESLEDELFLLQTLGDDRCVVETYIAGVEMKHRPRAGA